MSKGEGTLQHTSAVFHQDECLINTRAGLINGTAKVSNGILVTREQFL